MKKCRSIFFRDNVRLGRPVSGVNATRISIVEDARYEVLVDIGVEAVIRDTQKETKIRVPWHMVRDYELTDEDSVESKQVNVQVARKPLTLA